jgi:hypothetical protein
MITVNLPDGTKVQFPDGTSRETMKAALAKRFGAKTSLPEQVGSGTSEGIARALGAPVDLMTGALNLGSRGINAVAGTQLPQIQNPVGGSSTLQKLMDPFISDAAPQTTAQRYGRRIGQEVGFGTVAAPVAMLAPAIGPAARANLPAYAGTSLASDVAAGTAGQTAREVAPDSDMADFWASLLAGGGAGALASRAMPAYQPGMTRADVGMQADAKWSAVKAAPERLTDAATARLAGDVQASLPTSQLAPSAYPTAFRMAGETQALKNPSVYDVAELRRLFGDAVASNPQESRVGVGMKKATEDYLNRLTQGDVMGGDPTAAVNNLRAANELSARGHRYDAVDNKAMRAETRAATTGTGGNEVNATRQNVRTLYDRERDPTLRGQRKGFTPDEMAQMERIVMGTGPQNAARLIGRMAPTSGALPLMATGWGGAAGVGLAAAGGSPLAAIPALAGGIGFLGKAAAESMTKKEIQKLLDMIASGGNLKPGTARKASEAAVMQQLLSSALSGMPQ